MVYLSFLLLTFVSVSGSLLIQCSGVLCVCFYGLARICIAACGVQPLMENKHTREIGRTEGGKDGRKEGRKEGRMEGTGSRTLRWLDWP